MPLKSTIATATKCGPSEAPEGLPYRLFLTRQHSYEVDSVIENGQQKNLHYVIKGSAFVLEIALRKMDVQLCSPASPACASLDFTKITLEATLLYDCDSEERSVIQVRSRPLTTRGLVNPKSPAACRLETVVEALSSRHEDMNFKIKLAAVDMATKKKLSIPPVFTEPFQVISKPDVLLKKKQKSRKAPRKPTQTKQDQVLESLQRIEAQQAAQQSQLNYLMSQQAVHQQQPFLDDLLGTGGHSGQPHSLDAAFNVFVGALRKLRPQERPGKLRKLLEDTNPSDLVAFAEAAEVLQAQENSQNQEPPTQPTLEQAAAGQVKLEPLFSAEDLGPGLDELLRGLGGE